MKKLVANKTKKLTEKYAKKAAFKVAEKIEKTFTDDSAVDDSGAEETDTEIEENRLVTVKHGKLVYDIKFRTIKTITWISLLLLLSNVLFCLMLFNSSWRIRNHLGYFINMVSEGEGAKLPILQSIPVLIFLILDSMFALALWKIFKRKNQRKYNWILFITIIVDVIFMFLTIILLFIIMAHIYEDSEHIQDGIAEAMNNYANNSLFKKQIDRLQIEFQCCGSQKYDEWYTIQWYDSSLIKKGRTEKTQDTPFSCCSIKSLFPCIHHNIENTGKAYLYTPEQNLSISTTGCYDKILKKSRQVGWGIIGNLFLFIILQGLLLVGMRLLQTAHYARFMFEGHSRLYTIWVFGCGTTKESKRSNSPPPVPPVPDELMELLN